ncbi:WAS/WASL-interacting protein family member 2-like isoform X2 [Phyllopteryx taeniolatus]|uniref:WAS/WASL-interacting protein family member 2-like isoform X2 n=1 Tax=Phyllopteryx taeniolatus TaxID=161469 RepID=UPI002AD47EF8|nr:WAS/WASL-interacting protein family member 2-like isoform X2 [Phyllopteryx taeniolatus]
MPLPPPPFTQANRQSPEEVKGGPAHLLPDLRQGTDHPYFRLYQYLHQGAPHKNCAAGASPPRPPRSDRLHDDAPSLAPPPSAGSSPVPPSHRRRSRRGHAPSPPTTYNRDEPLPPAPPVQAPPSSLAPTTYGGEVALLRRHASPGGKRTSPSPVSPSHRPAPPAAAKEAPPPPPYRTAGSPNRSSDPPVRGKPPPPPPPPLRHGHASSVIPCLGDDFESKYLFHPLDDFPPPDEYRHFAKIYPSKAYSAMRGAPPLPPVGR